MGLKVRITEEADGCDSDVVKELALHLPVSEIEMSLGAAVQTGSVSPAFA